MKLNTAITYFIISVWAVILIFGILTLISPHWLEDLSDEGRKVEALSMKNFGDDLLKSNKFNEAVQQYNLALKIVPDHEGVLANLGIAYQKMGNYDKAIFSFNHLLKLDIKHPNVIYYNLGIIYEKTGQLNKARESYLMAANTAGFPEYSFQKAGQLYMDQKDWENAITYFKLAIDNRKTLENTYRGMLISFQKDYADTTVTYKELDRQIKSKSYLSDLPLYDEEIFDDLMSHEVQLAKAYNNAGYCLTMQEKYKEAKEYLETAIKIYPSFTVAINNLKIVNNYLSE
jgi:tetratricopeptide (TPR) repeat protein